MSQFLSSVLLKRGLLEPPELQEAELLTAAQPGKLLQEVLVEKELLTDLEILGAVAEELGLEAIEEIPQSELDPELMTQVPLEFLKRHLLLPLRPDGAGAVRVAMADPLMVHPL
ncbi:MAG: hypothetical protein HY303_00115, partial [Candidatus Wallbacteria bacterium]|nr:hypothetical protein [Candidatus Wallbacteria bacterium]